MAEEKKNIINMAEARKRQQTLQQKAKSKSHGAPRPGGGQGGKFKIAGYPLVSWLQFAVFLAVLAYFMHQCRGG